MEKNKINIFLDTYCILVSENEDSSITELMMDDHKCINYKGTEYYVPENRYHYFFVLSKKHNS